MKKNQSEKEVVFAYVSKDNREFVDALVKDSNQKISYIIDRILDAARLKKSIKIDKAVPQYVVKARNWEKRNQSAG